MTSDRAVAEATATSPVLAAPPTVEPAVVVGVDDSASSDSAVTWAAAEAVARQLPLRIVHAWTIPVLTPWAAPINVELASSAEVHGRALLQRYVVQAERTPGVVASAYQVDGSAGQVLGECAKHAALVVLGSHHLSEVGRMIAGSVSSAVTASAVCPTVVVPGSKNSGGRDPAPAGLPVVVGVTPYADQDARLVDFGLDHARRHRAPIRIVTCWHPALGNQTLPPPRELHLWLSEFVSGCRDRFPEVDRVELVVRRSQPRDVLLEAADQAALLVLGRRHRHTHLGQLLGSTGHAAVVNAACPVAIIPPQWPAPAGLSR
ncbi:universal stress protein [Jatrophihabitans sp.]|uniref:universal stress protein n=1 Tax=Jatrophihabitans sp. TaxID=1932789 RepID=UPI0030C685D2|nr:Universal stress protein family [Jatrophihabitans sp.]